MGSLLPDAPATGHHLPFAGMVPPPCPYANTWFCPNTRNLPSRNKNTAYSSNCLPVVPCPTYRWLPSPTTRSTLLFAFYLTLPCSFYTHTCLAFICLVAVICFGTLFPCPSPSHISPLWRRGTWTLSLISLFGASLHSALISSFHHHPLISSPLSSVSHLSLPLIFDLQEKHCCLWLFVAAHLTCVHVYTTALIIVFCCVPPRTHAH